jgi:hypothetical protein
MISVNRTVHGTARVGVVPHRGQHAAGPQHPGDLRVGPLAVEPVVGLAGHDSVDRAAGQRDLFCRPGQRGHAGARLDQPVAHPLVRFDRDHLVAEVAQHPAEDAGPGAEIGDAARGGAERPDDRLRRVGRPVAVVALGGGAERAGLRGAHPASVVAAQRVNRRP